MCLNVCCFISKISYALSLSAYIIVICFTILFFLMGDIFKSVARPFATNILFIFLHSFYFTIYILLCPILLWLLLLMYIHIICYLIFLNQAFEALKRLRCRK
uniref:Uncharacterized protein n=1 Tax=Cacopsylla melanoneura TaxID=428564 RepID=A0A8D8PP07_9HEMI